MEQTAHDDAPARHHPKKRQEILRRYHIIETPPEESFDRITQMAARVCEVPTALIALIDEERQWCKSCLGVPALEGFPTRELPVEDSFALHAVRQQEALIVEDATQDPRFADHPLVTGDPGVRFYAGVPLRTPGGVAVGTLSIMDHEPRVFDAGKRATLEDLARMTAAALERRRTDVPYRTLVENVQEIIFRTDLDGCATFLSAAWERATGLSVEDALGAPLLDHAHPQDRAESLQAFAPLLRREENLCRHRARFVTQNGVVVPMQFRARLLTDDEGRPVGTVGTLTPPSPTDTPEAEAETPSEREADTGPGEREEPDAAALSEEPEAAGEEAFSFEDVYGEEESAEKHPEEQEGADMSAELFALITEEEVSAEEASSEETSVEETTVEEMTAGDARDDEREWAPPSTSETEEAAEAKSNDEEDEQEEMPEAAEERDTWSFSGLSEEPEEDAASSDAVEASDVEASDVEASETEAYTEEAQEPERPSEVEASEPVAEEQETDSVWTHWNIFSRAPKHAGDGATAAEAQVDEEPFAPDESPAAPPTQDLSRRETLADARARLESDPPELRPASLDYAVHLRSALDELAPEARRQGVTVQRSLPGSGLTLETDPGALRLLVSALVNNALASTEEGGAISVSARVADDENEEDSVRLRVSDSGADISRSLLDSLLNVNLNEEAEEEGEERHLEFIHRLVNLMQGSVEMESQRGQGTVFTVMLPRHPAADVATPATQEAPVWVAGETGDETGETIPWEGDSIFDTGPRPDPGAEPASGAEDDDPEAFRINPDSPFSF